MPKPIIFDNFQKGIADSPHLGFADMRNLDVSSKPGVAQLTFQLQARTDTPISTTFTVVPATDILTTVSSLRSVTAGLRAVTVSSSGSLPAGLSPSTTYFTIDVSSATLKLATTYANASLGTAIDITDAGTGTHTITSVDMGIPQFFAKDSYNGVLYAQDSNGRIWFQNNGVSIWYLLTGNSLTNANAQGLAVYKNYLFAFRSGKVDVFGPSSSLTPSWTNDWQTLTQGGGGFTNHYTVVGQDDILYFSDIDSSVSATSGTPYIGTIGSVSGATFDPSGTINVNYTYNTKALTLPLFKTITGLDELGTNLMMGTVGREIYPWNRSATTFSFPIIAAEDGIKAMRTLNNILYFSAGTRGNIYATVGSSTKLVRRLPVSITNIPTNSVTIGAMVGHKSRLFFTVQCIGASGVYSLDPETGTLVLEHRVSSGSYGGSNQISLHCLYSFAAEDLKVGWHDQDASVNGIDATFSGTYYYTPGYVGYFDSDLRAVGTSLNPQTCSTAEVLLTKPLIFGQGVRLSYRKDLTSAFTLFATGDFTTFGGALAINFPAPITDATFVQIRAEITVSSQAQATPELRSVILT